MIGWSTWSRAVALLACAALLAGAFALSGCGGTKESPGGPSGTGIEEGMTVDEATAGQVTSALDAAGMKYNKDYLAMRPEGADKVLVTAGTITDTKNGNKKLSDVLVVKGKDGKWAVSSQ